MDQFIFTSWFWLVVGLALAGIEVFIPGVFLLWFGIAGMTLGVIMWFVPMGVALQLGALALLGVSYAYLGNRYVNDAASNSKLNARTKQLIGQRAVLIEAIRYGQGRIKLGDSEWKVMGPDLPVGTEVEIIEAQGLKLMVQVPSKPQPHDA